MAGPLLFAVPTVGALASVGPKLAAEVIERGGVLQGAPNPPSIEAMARAQGNLDSMKRSAEALRLLKKQGL